MAQFGTASLNKLNTADPLLRELFLEIVKHIDCTVLCGYRGQQEQDDAFAAGNSQLKFPESKHNQSPSQAVDVMPWNETDPHIKWPNLKSFTKEQMEEIRNYASIAHFAGVVRGMAIEMGIPIRWGGDWNRNFKMENQDDWDMPHYELDSK